jgi:hypothetical protein
LPWKWPWGSRIVNKGGGGKSLLINSNILEQLIS